MLDFNYYNPCKITFGKHAMGELKNLLRLHKASKLLLVYGGDFIKELGIYQHVRQVCVELGINFFENGDVVSNPRIELVRTLIEQGKTNKIDFILAVGGGSAIDTAKAVALGIPYLGDVWDFFEGSAQSQVSSQASNQASDCLQDETVQVVINSLPVGVVSTLPSSGSETSNCAIISNGLLKLGYEDDAIIPRFAIMNPSYTLELPPYQTNCGIADILSHLLERYFSDVTHTDFTDRLIEGAIVALLNNAERLLVDGHDYDARAEVQWIASVAHNNLLDTGRQADWGSHRIEHELSAQYGITHGEGMAVITLAWLRYVADIKPFKPAQLASRVFDIGSVCEALLTQESMQGQTQAMQEAHRGTSMLGVHNQVQHQDMQDMQESMEVTQAAQAAQATKELASVLESFFKKLQLATTLAELSIDDRYFSQMADRATKCGTQTVGHYLPLDREKFIAILRLAL